MKKNEIVVGVCEDYTNEGLGVAKVDGFPLFVKGLLRGERARLLVMKVKKGYGFAKIVELLEESGERQKPFCKIYQWCGGCQLQHMSLKELISSSRRWRMHCGGSGIVRQRWSRSWRWMLLTAIAIKGRFRSGWTHMGKWYVVFIG